MGPKMSIATLLQLLTDLKAVPNHLKEEDVLAICRITMKAESSTILFSKGHTEHEKFIIGSSDFGTNAREGLYDLSNKESLRHIKVSYRGFVDLLGRLALVATGLPNKPKGDSLHDSTAPKSTQTTVEKISMLLLDIMRITDTSGERHFPPFHSPVSNMKSSR